MRRHPVALTCGRKCHIRERFGSNIEVTKIRSLHVRVVIAHRISLMITFDTIGAEERRSELQIHRILPTAAFSAGPSPLIAPPRLNSWNHIACLARIDVVCMDLSGLPDFLLDTC